VDLIRVEAEFELFFCHSDVERLQTSFYSYSIYRTLYNRSRATMRHQYNKVKSQFGIILIILEFRVEVKSTHFYLYAVVLYTIELFQSSFTEINRKTTVLMLPNSSWNKFHFSC